jgi:hypothetical protein
MKSPSQVRLLLRRQWDNRTRREERLLGADDTWPLFASIGRPSAKQMSNELDAVKQHIENWRRVRIGEVVWEPMSYRATDSPVSIPIA